MQTKTLYKNLPETPGVYLMKGVRGKVLYIGKAGNLRRRVASYYLRGNDAKTEKLLAEIKRIDCQRTDTAIEALILESQLIKKYEPSYNAKEKDDKSFLYVEITKEQFPRVLLVRGKQLAKPHSAKASRGKWGPFTSATSIRQALRIIRKIFPYSTHSDPKLRMHANLQKKKTRKKGFVDSDKFARLPSLRSGGSGQVASYRSRPCFEYEIGLCPGTCVGLINRTDYLKTIRNIRLFLQGKKRLLLKRLESEMKEASKKLEFEKAEKLRRQIFALKHIQDTALIAEAEVGQFSSNSHGRESLRRIEGYDISNISGTSAVGSMIVFSNGKPDKDEYRKFKISTITQSDDTAMIKEVLRRRFNNSWSYPSLILIDGGGAQVNAVKSVLNEVGLKLPVVGIAKGPGRKKNEFVGYKPTREEAKILIKVRDEAHRFAISYHRKLRSGASGIRRTGNRN